MAEKDKKMEGNTEKVNRGFRNFLFLSAIMLTLGLIFLAFIFYNDYYSSYDEPSQNKIIKESENNN